jgi:hypothetical protein
LIVIIQRSSCISESVCGLEYLEYDDSNPLVLKAIHAALSVDERQSQEDMTVIGRYQPFIPPHRILTSVIYVGLIGENDESMDNNIEALSIPDSSLQVIPHCKIGASWYYGVLDGLHTRDTNYLVSCRTNVMIQSASLPILSLATGGRMTPQRLWRLAMLRGRSEGTDDYVLDGIDYGEVESVLDVTIRLMSEIGEVHLSDVELIKKAVIHQGRFWMWVRPDR